MAEAFSHKYLLQMAGTVRCDLRYLGGCLLVHFESGDIRIAIKRTLKILLIKTFHQFIRRFGGIHLFLFFLGGRFIRKVVSAKILACEMSLLRVDVVGVKSLNWLHAILNFPMRLHSEFTL